MSDSIKNNLQANRELINELISIRTQLAMQAQINDIQQSIPANSEANKYPPMCCSSIIPIQPTHCCAESKYKLNCYWYDCEYIMGAYIQFCRRQDTDNKCGGCKYFIERGTADKIISEEVMPNEEVHDD